MKIPISAIVFSTLLAQTFGAYVFPDDFKICKRTDPNLNGCILNAIRDAWPKLADPGISSPITIKTEPVFSPYSEFHPNNAVVNVDEYLFNSTTTGFDKSEILSANVDLSTLALNFTTFSLHLIQKSTYRANGTVKYNGTRSPDPIWGSGTVVKELYNTTILHQIKSIKVEKNGEPYLQVENYNVSASLAFITLDYQNLYNGTDPELARRVGAYINASALYITASLKPYVEEFLGETFRTYAKPIIGSIPISKLLPTSE